MEKVNVRTDPFTPVERVAGGVYIRKEYPMNWTDLRDETLTMEEVSEALSDDWYQTVVRHFRDRNVNRKPRPIECVMFYIIAKKRRESYQQRSLFE